ncbi:hypothetical protein MVEN_01498900 [Mycena venus]|uniref:Uncharacterized protein n=1 Tax=Mycena venus TaxID=2733690 RepID=A0A8H6XSS5_9AGAR|nr:hypothetical protein MVEN_01498900 [Mycena venus]
MPNSASVRGSPPPTAQSWAPPKNPLPPHRLARLANALGVSTPMPAIHTPSPMLSPSYNGSSPALDQYRRSPTPSTATSFGGFAPATSRYLLHVIPPIHLPHDADSFDSELTPPPSTASGYHTQFRRGTLVPVHSTLQSQLGAIAKEYALPSTAGLILYLVSQPRSGSSNSGRSPPPSEKSFGDELEEPGPRLSEDIWRHLWTRVVKTELRDEGIRTRTPLPLLSTNTGGHATLQPPFTPSPTTPSSTSEPPIARFHTKSAPPSSSNSRSPSDDVDAETPATSQAASERADSLDLPGLNSDALIPILAKVEFDIDRRKAGWYEPWLRSRRMNHAKRKNSMTPSPVEEGDRRPPLPFRLGQKKEGRRRASSLLSATRDRDGKRRYLPLSESPQSMEESDSESGSEHEEKGEVEEKDEVEEEGEVEEEDEEGYEELEDGDEEAGKDPLAEVFGEDADTWADMRASSSSLQRPSNPHVVQLALSAAELRDEEELDDEDEGEADADDAEEDVREVVSLMNQRPQLGVEIPGMQHSASRKRAPPPTPLVLHPTPTSAASTLVGPDPPPPMPRVVPPAPGSGSDAAGTPPDARLAYLEREHEREHDEPEKDDEQDKDMLNVPRKSIYNPSKRRGDVYDDMDLGFEVTEGDDDFDMDDPNDRRKSQIVMRAQLDEIEKTLAQFSPRMLRTDLEEQPMPSLATAASSPSLSPPNSSGSGAFGQYPPMPSSAFMPVSNADVFPPTPRLPHHPDHEEESEDSDDLSQQAAWPAVPYTSLAERSAASPAGQHSPPQLAVNGVSAAMPKRFRAGSSSRASSMHSTASSESELRKRDLAEHYPAALTPPAAYPAMTPSIGAKSSLSSPLIPLSPDPFGRVPSQAPEVPGPGPPGGKRTSKSYWEPPVVIPAPGLPPQPEMQRKTSNASISSLQTGAPTTVSSSRFSTDSIHGVAGGEGGAPQKQTNRTTLMSVKSIKNLWRKSRKESVSIPNTRPPMDAVHENAWSPLSPLLPNGLPTQRPQNPAVPMMTPPLPPSPNPASLPPPPQRPNRPSMEELDLPDVELELPPRTPVSAGFPGSPRTAARPLGASPRPSLQERRPSTSTTSSQEPRPSISQDRRPSVSQERRPSMSQERRPSQDQMLGVPSRRASPEGMLPHGHQLGVPSRRASPEGMPPSPHMHAHQLGMPSRRPSPEQVPPLPQHPGYPARRPSDAQAHMSVQSQMSMQPNMIVPPPMLQSTKNAPIIAAKAGPPRHAMNDGLLWDQESPYPTRVAAPPARAPSVSSSTSRPPSRPPSPPAPAVHPSTTPPNTSPPIPQNPSPPMPEKERRNSARKSILKWKSQTNGANGGAVPAPLTPSAATFRTRKTSLSGSPSQGSPLNLPMDIPPSPKIPEQFISSYVGSHPPPPVPASRPNSAAIAQRRLSAKMASTSTDSSSSRRQSQHHRPRGSTASSAHSEDTHESTNLDTSGFEIVSPRMGGGLSFPYTELDHDRPLMDGVRM